MEVVNMLLNGTKDQKKDMQHQVVPVVTVLITHLALAGLL
jgi:hypothetical protein